MKRGRNWTKANDAFYGLVESVKKDDLEKI
jgi:hypothetical protein